MLRGLPSIIDSIFGKTDLDSISVNEIQDVIAEFPSFNAAHYLLSKKLKQQQAETYEKQSMRTALYFNNALWLNSILNSDELHHETITSSKFDAVLTASEPAKSEYEDSEYSEPGEIDNEEPTQFREVEAITQISNPETSNENTREFISEYGVLEDIKPDQKFDEESVFTDEQYRDSRLVEDSLELQTITNNPAEAEINTNDSFNKVEGREFELELPVEDLEKLEPVEKPDDNFTPHGDQFESEVTKPVELIEQHDYTPEPGKPVFDAKNADSIVFAPYHMVDYFASQGIKLVLEDNPSDNFGKQLKSFTDWLKVMKKIPVRTREVKTDEKEADRIKHFASNSLEDRDILTESMAEVLAKQGMYENAINLYQKLSLIYPPKSAYFASRIDQLKAKLP